MVLTLCGSTRFEPWFHLWNEILTMAGHTVFTLTAFPSIKGDKNWYTPEEKAALDQAHVRKIHESDGIVVLNPFAYLGPSTLNEIACAKGITWQSPGRSWGSTPNERRCRVFFLESWGKGLGISGSHTREIQAAARRFDIPDGFGSPIDTFSGQGREDVWNSELLGEGGAFRSGLVARIERFKTEVLAGPCLHPAKTPVGAAHRCPACSAIVFETLRTTT